MNADDAQSIFVRNLPFSATTRDLEELCGGIGPVKRASIIQSADGVSRGFGFVKFAIPEDAVRAAAILASTDLKGRTLSVELAVKRGQKPAHAPLISTAKGGKGKDSKKAASSTSSPSKEAQDEKEEGEDSGKKQKKVEATGSQAAARPTVSKGSTSTTNTNKRGKAAAAASASTAASTTTTTLKKKPGHALLSSQPSKTLIVFNLASQTTEKQLYKRVKKIETPKSIKTEVIDGLTRVAILVFDTPTAAKKVQKKLDQHTIHGQKLSLRPFHPAGDKGAATAGVSGVGEAGTPMSISDLSQMRGQAKRNNRLIIRNLSFKATKEDLKNALSAFGPVLEASIPQVNVRGVEGRRGFGFVTFACAEDAQKAVKHEGGLKVQGREVAVDMCMGRREYQQDKQKKTAEGEASVKKEDAAKTESALPMEEEASLSDAEASDEEVESSEGRSDDEDDDEDEDKDEDADNDEDEMGEEEEEEESEDEDGAKKAAPKPSDVNEGKTVFLRNIPFDATPESLKMAFHDYAPVAFAIIVKDRATGMSKGTAFVKFKSAQGMDIVLDAAAAAGGSLTLLGRDLKVDRAMEREDAPQAKVPGSNPDGSSTSNDSANNSKADRRNLYLANEGLVVDSEAQDEIPKSDLDKRKREQAEKKTKLRNPFFFVSPTRLSIRNLGRTILDNDLRALLVQAVQKGLEAEVVTSDDLKMHLRAQGLYEQASDPKCLVVSVPRPRDIHVKVKVMRDLDKKPEDGVYPSRGYGFADFSSHVHALAGLRHVNNNPAFASYAIKGGGGKRSRLIVSFAVENHKALQKKILRGEKVRTAAAPEATRKGAASGRGDSHPKKRKLVEGQVGNEDGSGGADLSEKGAADVGEKKLSRGQRQRELKRQRKSAGGDEGPARRTRTGAISVGKLGKAAAALHQRSEKRAPTSAPGNEKPVRRPPQQPDSRSSSRGRGGVEEQGEDELTRLAAAAATGGEAKKGRRKSGVQKESNEDKQFVQTVNAYKQKLLGGGVVTAGAGAGVGAGKGKKEEEGKAKGKAERWFE